MVLGAFWDNITEAARQTGKPLKHVLSELCVMGYKAVNVSLATSNDPAAFRAALEADGMRVGDAFDYLELTRRPLDTDDMDRRYERARAIGAQRFLYIPCQYGDAPESDMEALLCEGLAQASERAAEFGLEPVIEAFDVGYTPLCHPRVINMALNAAPKLRLAFDTGNYLHGGYDALSELAASSGRLAGCAHLKDRARLNGNGDAYTTLGGEAWYPRAVGDGEMHLAEVIAALKSYGFDGVLYAEQYGSARQLEDLTRSAAFIKREWGA